MDQKILVFSGNKQSGKSSSSNFVHGLFLQRAGVIKRFEIADNGDLVVNTSVLDDKGNQSEGEGVLDLYSNEDSFVYYDSQRIWHHIKRYSFAEPLKDIAITVLGLKSECVYGTDEQKNELTHIKWKSVCRFLLPKRVKEVKDAGKYSEFMTNREVLEELGTSVFRHLHDPCWCDAAFNRILSDNVPVAIIDDARFENEILGAQDIGARVIRLKNTKYPGGHKSNTALDKWEDNRFDAVINTDMTNIKEKNFAIIDALKAWGWFE